MKFWFMFYYRHLVGEIEISPARPVEQLLPKLDLSSTTLRNLTDGSNAVTDLEDKLPTNCQDIELAAMDL